MSKIAIEATNVSAGYGKGKNKKIVISDVNFTLCSGDFSLMLGCNGAGKSTLLRTIAGVQDPLEGSINVCGQNVANSSTKDLSCLMSAVFTDKTFAGGLRVKEVVEIGRYPYTGFFGELDKTDNNVVENSLAVVGMAQKGMSFFSQISDGERQKVMIAKALAQETPIILLDEPTAFLDLPSRMEILYLLRSLASENGKTIILSTHDIEQSLPLADKVLLFCSGSLLCRDAYDAVRDGLINRIFADRNIKFDNLSGKFVPLYTGCRRVAVEAPEDIIYWIKEVIRGIGFEPCTVSGEESTITVYYKGENNIVVGCNGKVENLGSFAMLGKWLTALKQMI